MQPDQSLLAILQVPREAGVTLFAIAICLLLLPHLAGLDFGVVKLPPIEEPRKRAFLVGGPVFFVFALLLHFPFITARGANRLTVALVPYITPAGKTELAAGGEALTSQLLARLGENSEIRLVSPRSSAVLGPRETAAKIGVELGAGTVLEGRVDVVSDGHLLVTTTLVNSHDNVAFWSQRNCIAGDLAASAYLASKRIARGVFEELRTSMRVPNGFNAPAPLSCEFLEQSHSRAVLQPSFEGRTAVLSNSADAMLRTLADALNSDRLKGVSFLISASVVATENGDADWTLSHARANAVMHALVALGVDERRLAAMGKQFGYFNESGYEDHIVVTAMVRW